MLRNVAMYISDIVNGVSWKIVMEIACEIFLFWPRN